MSTCVQRRAIAFGLILLCAFTTEAAVGNSIRLANVDDHGRTEAIAGIAYVGVIPAQTITRVAGVGWLARLGCVVTLRLSAVLIVCGAICFAFPFPVALSAAAIFPLAPAAKAPVGVGTGPVTQPPPA